MPYIIRGDNIIEVEVVQECCMVRISKEDVVLEEFIVPKEEIFMSIDEAKGKLKSILCGRISELQTVINDLSSKIREFDTKERKEYEAIIDEKHHS